MAGIGRLWGVFVLLAANALVMADTPASSEDTQPQQLHVGVVLPLTSWRYREYRRQTMLAHQRLIARRRQRPLAFLHSHQLPLRNIHLHMLSTAPSPISILQLLCETYLPQNVTALVHVTSVETYGHSTASSQYLHQLTAYLQLPLISWNADNSGLHDMGWPRPLRLQLAPVLRHQVRAMLSIMRRYRWHRVFLVTSTIAGHSQFVQTVRNEVDTLVDFSVNVIGSVTIQQADTDLAALRGSDARIILLYSTRDEADTILASAAKLSLTGRNYVWIAAQSVQGNAKMGTENLPVGMLGVHFPTDEATMTQQIGRALSVFVHGFELMNADVDNTWMFELPRLSCHRSRSTRWQHGPLLYRYLRNVSIDEDTASQRPLQFAQDGSLLYPELVIRNLRPSALGNNIWEPIGVWRATGETSGELNIRDIVWPGYSHVPPQGVPEKFHLRIAFMEESPYIMFESPDPQTGRCEANRGVPCQFSSQSASDEGGNSSRTAGQLVNTRCCSGFCIDLLEKFAADLGFTYDLVRNEDGLWGARVLDDDGVLRWNGLPGSLINNQVDMVMTSFKINSYRQSAVQFTVPFLDTGITIVVAKRTGIISATAFLEPFDTASWLLVALVAIQAAALVIFVFEWLSPSGYDMKMAAPANYGFSLFRTFWMVWAILLQAAVHLDVPRGLTAKFMSSIWALFALIFLAIYTANLAAFMITREEFYNLKGIDDPKLQSPDWRSPPFRFGTVLYGNTDSVLKQNFPAMRQYMLPFNRSSVSDGIQAVKRGELDAFIYDATVLEYYGSQDDDCKLITVGEWYAMTGYGVAFQRDSKYTRMFDEKILEYRQTGDIERIHQFWFTGSCKPNVPSSSSSKPLTLDQFLSTFLLLGCAVLLSLILLLLENFYFRCIRRHIAWSSVVRGLCSLLSLTLSNSLAVKHNSRQTANTRQLDMCCGRVRCRQQTQLVLAQLKMAHQRLRRLKTLAAPARRHRSTPDVATVGLCHDVTMTSQAFDQWRPSYVQPTYSPVVLAACGRAPPRGRSAPVDTRHDPLETKL